MFPLKDNIPSRSFPYVTMLLLILNVIVFIYQLSLGKMVEDFFLTLGVIPYQITHGIDIYPTNNFPIILSLITGMFVHGGFLHIFGNMLYLWIFGDNVEGAIGHLGFLIFYLLCGLIAFYTQIYLNPDSKVPVIGASGAISGVLGAYLLLFPYARISARRTRLASDRSKTRCCRSRPSSCYRASARLDRCARPEYRSLHRPG